MEVLKAATDREAEGGSVIHLEVGQPSSGAPSKAIAAAHAALDRDRIGYTAAFGLPQLRNRVASHYQDRYGVSIPPDKVVITTGSSGGFVLAFAACFDAGDRVALAAPGYPGYRNILLALDIEPVIMPVSADSNFQPTVKHLQAAETEGPGGRLHGLIIASPSNPTGTVIAPHHLREILEYCTARGIRVISDEIYHGIIYDGIVPQTAIAIDPAAVVINSFSKYYSMTGWRIGWLIVPEELRRNVECLAQNLYINAPTLSQHAALAAFDCCAELDAHVERYSRNRALLMRELPRAGFHQFASSDGAFYIYAEVSHMTDDSQALCRRILDEAGVAITPGVDFDHVRGHTSVRFSFSGSTDDMAEAMRRLNDWTHQALGDSVLAVSGSAPAPGAPAPAVSSTL